MDTPSILSRFHLKSGAIGAVVGAIGSAALSACTGPYCALMKAIFPSLLSLFQS